MGFVKGILAGTIVGVAVGAMNSDNVMHMFRKGKKDIKRLRRKIGM
ncbi:MAG: hypothetical protein RR290_03935 [Clostridia bacterium]